MKVWALWHGGYSYGAPWMDEHLEVFGSIAEARQEFWDRYTGSGTFDYVRQERQVAGTPAVDESAHMLLFLRDPSDERDPYPDRVMEFGKRGGIRVERA